MDSAVNALQQRLSDAIRDTMKNVEQQGVRRMMADMYKCNARCADDTSLPTERLDSCIDGCSRILQTFNQEVSRELDTFQNRFQRCAMDCQDRVRDQGNGQNDSQLLDCLTKCTDDHIKLVPPMSMRLEASMNKALKEKLPH